MRAFNILDRPRPERDRLAGLALLAVIGAFMAYAVMPIVAGSAFGPHDALDDTMRMVQVRDWMGGQSWFDTMQYRMGPEGGTAMHWSRLVDLPIAVLAWILTPFLGGEKALSVSVTLWPVCLAVGMIGAFAWGGQRIGNSRWGALVGAVVGVSYVSFSGIFNPGQVDHHNVQQLCFAVAVAALLAPARQRRDGAIAGVAIGVSLAIGIEMQLLCALFCVWVALDWAVSRDDSGLAGAFGLGLAGSVTLAFFATTAPSQWGGFQCDQLSAVICMAALSGGGGLFALDTFARDDRLRRLIGLGALGLICGGILLASAPHCLSNPLDTLPEPLDQYWLSKVDEAKPLFRSQGGLPVQIALYLALPLISAAFIFAHWRQGRLMRGEILIGILLLCALGFTLYQIRFRASLWLLSSLATMIGLVRWRGPISRNSTGLLILTLAITLQPGFFAIPAVALFSPSVPPAAAGNVADTQDDIVAGCVWSEVADALGMMEPGLVLAPYDAGPTILLETEHSVLSGNYHRNLEGLGHHIAIATQPADEALRTLRDVGVDYVVFCPAEMKLFEGIGEDALYSRLAAQDTIPGLRLIREDATTLYAVEPALHLAAPSASR